MTITLKKLKQKYVVVVCQVTKLPIIMLTFLKARMFVVVHIFCELSSVNGNICFRTKDSLLIIDFKKGIKFNKTL